MHRFSRARRLLTKRDFNRVFQEADKVVTREFVAFYTHNAVGYARLGLALSKKIIAKAHDRNKIRRVLRETFRTNHQLPAVDVIIIARAALKDLQPSTLLQSVNKLWDKLACAYEQ